MKIIYFIAVAALLSVLCANTARCGEIVVSAAASLTDAFREIEWHYDRPRPDGGAAMNFGSSGALLRQMEMGAPVDVFVSADEYTMRLAVEKGLVYEDSIVRFAANSLVLITPADSDAGPSSIEGLGAESVGRIAIGNPASVPAGRYAKAALERRGIWNEIADRMIYAEDVRQVLDYVRRGEVDAGVVYGTDAARAGGAVRVVAEIHTVVPITYPVAVAVTTSDRKAAEGFIEYLGNGMAVKILTEHGFAHAGGSL